VALPALARAADYAAPVVIEKSPAPRPIAYRWMAYFPCDGRGIKF
jgi:hypothetical protein